MNKETIIQNTIRTLNLLPVEKVNEVRDFAEYLLSKLDDAIIIQGIQTLASSSESLEYLHEEEDLYTVNDLKEVSMEL